MKVCPHCNGITEETIKSEEVLPGLDATAPEAPVHRDFVFTGWDKEVVACAGNTVWPMRVTA